MITHWHHDRKGELIMGKDCWVSPTADFDLTGTLILQDTISISDGVRVFTHKHNYKKSRRVRSHDWTVDDVYTTTIGKDVFIGVNAILIGVKNVGDGAIIGAGSVVTKDVPSYEVWAGNPAVKIGERTDDIPAN